MAVILIVVMLSSLVTTWLPSIKPSRMCPAEVLRYQ
jgi:ABC-type lipoprotein release transport system permease subunit